MNGATAKRGTHGLRKRCPLCKHLRKFYEPTEGNSSGRRRRKVLPWHKINGRWTCNFCFERGKESLMAREILETVLPGDGSCVRLVSDTRDNPERTPRFFVECTFRFDTEADASATFYALKMYQAGIKATRPPLSGLSEQEKADVRDR